MSGHMMLGPSLFAISVAASVGRHNFKIKGSGVRRSVDLIKRSLNSVLGVTDWELYDGQHAYLEAVDSEEALGWVKSRNQHALSSLGNPETNAMYTRVLSILNSKDKIPHVDKIGDWYYNFWQDEQNQRGILRRTTLLSFKSPDPVWETVLDIDALGKAENVSWVYKGYTLYHPDDESDPLYNRRILFELSNGGADATVVREFDLHDREFVSENDNGFIIHEAKQRVYWKDANTLLVGTDMKPFGIDTVTNSGYPRVVYQWRRGTKLTDAKVVFEGDKTDVAVMSYVAKHRNYRVIIRYRSLTFYTSKKTVKVLGYYNNNAKKTSARNDVIDDDEAGWKEVPIPADAQMGMFADQLLVTLRSEWSTGSGTSIQVVPAGSLLAANIEDVLANGASAKFTILFTPSARVSLSSHTKTKNFLIISTLENVKSRLHFWSYAPTKKGDLSSCVWKDAGAEENAVIRGSSVVAVDSHENDFYWFTTSSFTTPSTLSLGNAMLGPSSVAQAKRLKSLPPQFDSTGLVEAQYEATSKDGTKVPYFIVYTDKNVPSEKTANQWWPRTNAPAPTLLYGYGGFEISLTPAYAALVGSGWLEKGGVYVTANIRGGGEFGPSWHQAAKRENRQKAYDDFIAVAEDLIKRGVTSAPRLGIRGGSNGGLLMGNMITQRPDLFGAVCCAVPLLDMKIFHRLLAGNSWMAEYGNPDTDDWSFLKAYSAYHNIDAGSSHTTYPPLLMTTSTRDDRVHPYHARSFVKRLIDVHENHQSDHDKKSQSLAPGSVYYYENIEGGHGGAADNKQQAFMNVMYLDFLAKTIGKGLL